MNNTDVTKGCLTREDQTFDDTIDSVQKSLSTVALELDCIAQTVNTLHELCVELREKYRLKSIATDVCAPDVANVEIVIDPEALPAALQKPEKPDASNHEAISTTQLEPLFTHI